MKKFEDDPMTTVPLDQTVPPASRAAAVLHVEHDHARPLDDQLAEEYPVALEFNGITHAIMLASPLDLEDFAVGFALTEGIIDAPHQLYDLQLETGAEGITVKIEIAGSCLMRLKDKRRQLTGRTGCGLCGAESLTHVLRPLAIIPPPVERLSVQDIDTILANLNDRQALQRETGATHAAAWFDLKGKMKWLREDIGRHNALDKVIGAAYRTAPVEIPDGPLVVTSRASMEMVQKAVSARTPYLIALSAPTALAVRLAERYGLCLIGFARHHSLNVYSHPEYLSGLVA